MKAIILAAGMGTRLGKYTQDLPKGMVSFNGLSLIERQVEILRASGIEDIHIVRGYRPEKIQIPDVSYYQNDDFDKTNMVSSLFCAEGALQGEVLVCYSDIVYQQAVLEKIKEANVEVGVTVDEDYLEYWRARLDDWQDDLESLVLDESGLIKDLGQKTTDLSKAALRYVGLIKFSETGVEKLKRIFHDNRQKYWDSEKPWLNSKNFKNAYMTDMLQVMINAGVDVKPIVIKRGWLEFDTVEDYEKAISWYDAGTLDKFIVLPK